METLDRIITANATLASTGATLIPCLLCMRVLFIKAKFVIGTLATCLISLFPTEYFYNAAPTTRLFQGEAFLERVNGTPL